MSDIRRDESGAVLILALIFVIVTGLVGVALASLTSTNLMATSSLQAARGTQFGADGAVDGAIENVRYSGATFATTMPCFPPNGNISVNGTNTYVYCDNNNTAVPAPSGGRSIVFTGCSSPLASCPPQDLLVTAQVTFGDCPLSGCFGGNQAFGTAVTIVSWEDSA